MNKVRNIAVFMVLPALLVGMGTGYWFASAKHPEKKAENTKTEQTAEAQKEKPEILFYRNPMNPAITSPVPAKDEMGMDYIPVYADGENKEKEPAGTVTIDPVVEQNIGVRTAVAKKQVLNRQIRAVGRVAYDEELLFNIHPKVEGWIEKLFVKDTGSHVKQDTILLSIYSPQLVASQQEYLLALNNYEVLKDSPIKDIRDGAAELLESSRKRLEFLDVPAHQLEELTKDHVVKKNLHIHSPYAGIVLDIGIREGDYVTPKTKMYALADLSKVWVYVDIYEFELPWIQEKDKAEMTLAAIPGRTFTGTVAYIYPYMEKKTRTARIRLEVDNKEGLLKPDMYANVTVMAGKEFETVVVPAEAIVRSGERDQVFIRREKRKFEPREVTVGVTAAGMTQILEGVQPGEVVVTSSQFLIDSESKLREATAKMLDDLSASSSGSVQQKTHDDMDMADMTLDNLEDEDLDMSGMTLENLQ